ncbi:hypothetical protein ACHAW6_011736 [Cyclotella cf. meneghiniana]
MERYTSLAYFRRIEFVLELMEECIFFSRLSLILFRFTYPFIPPPPSSSLATVSPRIRS